MSSHARLQRKAVLAYTPPVAPPIVHEVLRSSGEPLDSRALQHFGESLPHDLSGVRVHTGDRAAQSAAALNARAYTVGQHVVFGHGEYQPGTQGGQKLLSHELIHTVQQRNVVDVGSGPLPIDSPGSALEREADQQGSSLREKAPSVSNSGATVARTSLASGPVLQRFPTSYAEAKTDFYKGLIQAARKGNNASIALLRRGATHLPESLQGIAGSLITIDDVTIGAITAVGLAIVGIVVGFGEGVADLIKGVCTMIYGAGKLFYDLFKDLFTGSDSAKKDLVAFWEAIKGLPDAIKKLCSDWLDRFMKASSEQQSLMIGELTGQVLALIATWGVSAGRAGTAAKVATEGVDVAAAGAEGARAGAAATDAATAGSRAAKGADVIDMAAARARRAAATQAASTAAQTTANTAYRGGSAALKLAPAIEEAPAIAPVITPLPAPVPLPVPSPAIAPAVAAAAGKGTTQAIVAATGVAAAKATAVSNDDKKKKRPPFVLRLPREKSKHLGLYRNWLGVLQSDPAYDRGNPAQRRKWTDALHSDGSHAIPAEVWERGHSLGLTGEKGEERIAIPDWSRETKHIAMEVDHIVELQLTPERYRAVFDDVDYYELLDRTANGSAGPRLRGNVAAERAKQEAFDPSLIGQVIPFDKVELDGGGTGQRWGVEEIRSGEQLDVFERQR